MDTIIYCFSGRGNSLSVARGLAARMEGARLAPMDAGGGEVALPAGRVGLVLPVIDLGIPSFVRRFISRLAACGEAHYVFAVITCGGMPCASMAQVQRLLGRRGLRLSAGWIVRFGLEPMAEGEWTGLLNGIAAAASNRQNLPLPAVSAKDRLMTGLANPLARLLIPGEDRKFRVSEACTGCGTCARVCPAGNVTLEGGRPVWHHRCEQCAACFNWCPAQAITGTNLAARTRFTNPRTTLAQMTEREAGI